MPAHITIILKGEPELHKPSDVYIKRAAAFLPNLPVGNEQMEAVLGIAGDTPSRVRKMILRSNAITSR